MSVASKPSNWPKSRLDGGPRVAPGELRVPLRLSVTRGRLGLEIYEPFDIGPLHIEHLAQSFLGLKFPLDLSGGVPSFRHRRGNLERVVISTDLDRLRTWAEPRVRSVLGPLVRPIDLWWHGSGLGIGIVRESSAIAWDLHWVPLLGHARLVVSNARGWGLTVPVLVEVLRLMDTLGGRLFARRGRVLTLKDAGRTIGRALLPAVGARAPAATDVAFGALQVDERKCRVELDSNLAQADLSVEATRCVELSRIAEPGDEALARGELDEARNCYLMALESAPRQKELVLLVAEIDVSLGRIEAALGLIGESMPVLTSAAVGASALLRRGESDAAKELLALAASEERYSPLAALLQLARAACESSSVERRMTLDAAVAAAPALAAVRWARLEARAEFGDAAGTMSDAQHLEASVSGRHVRYGICRRAADLMLAAGLEQSASVWFQRALRYAPEDVASMVGLARSLQALGEGLRAIPLLERAVQVAGETGPGKGDALVELAKLVATKLNDLPQAVARLRAVPQSDALAISARGLEGRFRSMLGDVVGASVAFGRMRDLIEITPHDGNSAVWLVEAARFERDFLKDHAAAERHLALALRVAPHQAMVQELYREVAAVLAARRHRRTATRDAGLVEEPSGVDQGKGSDLPGAPPR
jgi:cellulose synthase operon protein C